MSKTRKSNKTTKWPSQKEIRNKMIKNCPQLATVPLSALEFYTKEEWAAMELMYKLKMEQPTKFQRAVDILKARHDRGI